jgi:hypothetical protein
MKKVSAQIRAFFLEAPVMNMVDGNTWFRSGRGLGFQFNATDDNIASILETCLFNISPEKFYILATFFNKIGKQYMPSSRKIEASEISVYGKNGIWNFFIECDDITHPILFLPKSMILIF